MKFNYVATHVHVEDQSTAMMVCSAPFVLVNEDGFAWDDDPDQWVKIN